MKFISKSSNLLIVLRPGMSAQPLTGAPAVPTVSVRFKDGMADVQDPKFAEMMLAHSGFNSDFISAEEVLVDPYAGTRQSSEPAHVLTELKFGTPVSKETKGGNMQIPPELQKMVVGLATQMSKEMLPSMVESTLKSILASHEGAKVTETKAKKKPGRKPKIKNEKTEGVPASVSVGTASGAPDLASNPATQESAS